MGNNRVWFAADDGTRFGLTVRVTGGKGTNVNFDFEVDDEPMPVSERLG